MIGFLLWCVAVGGLPEEVLLLGDSMLRRLRELTTRGKTRNSILCHGGQSIWQLPHNIQYQFNRILPTSVALMLIGTNNLHGSPLGAFNMGFRELEEPYRHLGAVLVRTNITR